jgi:hypothetical protein
MTLCDDSFLEFVSPLVLSLEEKNRFLQGHYGLHKFWDWNPATSYITFYDPVLKPVRVKSSIVGTIQDHSWEWSWANPNIAEETKEGISKIRAFGMVHGYESLQTASFAGDKETGWQMAAVAVHVLNAPGAFQFATGHGTCYLLYRIIEELDELDESTLLGAKQVEEKVLPATINLDLLVKKTKPRR